MSRRPLLLLLTWLLLMIAGSIFLRGTQVTQDLTQFLPEGATKQERFAASLLHSGPANRLILIGLGNAPPQQLAESSRQIAKSLEANELFDQVNNGAQITSERTSLERRYRYLLDPSTTSSSFDRKHLRIALQTRLKELSGAIPVIDRWQLTADPTAALLSLLTKHQNNLHPKLLYGVWFTPDERWAVLTAVTRASGLNSKIQRQAIEAIHSAFKTNKHASDEHLILSGTPVFADSARSAIRSSMQLLSISASVLVATLLLVVYRSIRLVMLSILPILSALLMGGVVTSIFFGSIHGITLAFGITLLGVAIDYPIHLFSHLRADRTPQQTMSQIWPTLRLGVITTCVGYLAFIRRDFTGLAELGTFTTSGLLTAAAVTRWLLPSLANGITAHDIHTARIMAWPPANGIRTSSSIAILVTSGIVAVLLMGFSPPRWETDLSALSPVSDTVRHIDNTIRNAIGAPDVRKLIVISGTDQETMLENCERAVRILHRAVTIGLVSGIDAPTLYLPSKATQKLRQSLLPDTETAKKNLASALHGLPFRKNAFTPFLDSIADSRTLPPLSIGDVDGTLTGLHVQPLIFRDNAGWHALILLSGIAPGNEFRSWFDGQDVPDAVFIDIKQISTAMLVNFRNNTMERLLAGVGLILLVLSIGMKSVTSALGVMTPILLAVVMDCAVLGAIGERLSLFHLVALLLTTGIGIDYSLFFRHGEERIPDRTQTLHALLMCAASTVTAFAILACSSIPVLHSIGITTAIGASLCFLLSFAASGVHFKRTGN